MTLCVNVFVCAMLNEKDTDLLKEFIECAAITKNFSKLHELEGKLKRREDIKPLLQEFEKEKEMLKEVFSVKAKL